MSEVDIDTFARAHAGGAEVIDVREPQEYLAGHVPGAKLIPMRQLPGRLEEIEQRPVYVVCASGNRSLAVTNYLRDAGYEAHSVAGGTSAWARGGRQIIHGRERG
jgi:rhodanese-related sulfurtransferase